MTFDKAFILSTFKIDKDRIYLQQYINAIGQMHDTVKSRYF